MKRVAVILSGCGVYDGSEIHEAVITLLALDEAGATVQCAAPDAEQAEVIDHLSGGTVQSERRNILREAARIARGSILPVDELEVGEFDAFIFVGGYGAAKNLCDLAFKGADYTCRADVTALVRQAREQEKVLGFMCIAPALAAAALGSEAVALTIGKDAGTAAALEAKGARHVNCAVDDIVVDEPLKVVSTPAYMLADRISEAAVGIRKLVTAVLARC